MTATAPGRTDARAAADGGERNPEAALRLDVDEIQAHILAGFAAPLQTALFFEIHNLSRARRWVTRVSRHVTPLAAGHRGIVRTGVAVAFSYEGLSKLADDAERFREPAFKEGLHARSPLLGDPLDEAQAGHPRNWLVGGPGRVPDGLVLVAAGRRPELRETVARVFPELHDGIQVSFVQEAAVLRGHVGRHEHFGFRDPVSQPAVRGFTEPAGGVRTADDRPGRRLIWPGEFVFGYPGQSAVDLHLPGPLTTAGPEWTRNGSFLVARRLRQDVAAFKAFVAAAARRLELPPELVAAKCFGRWPSGAPLVLAAVGEDRSLGRDDGRNNDFGFAADSLGLACPHAAHIRKAYLRDQPTSDIVGAGVETHRLLRRSIPFGPAYPLPGERGLLFLAYQTSIERQFEFVTRAWLNNPRVRDHDEGHDPIVGQNGRHPERLRRFAVPTRDAAGDIRPLVLMLDQEFVVPTGGAYLFAPAIGALRRLGGG